MLLLSDKDSILDKILKSYEIYYDVEKCQDQSLPLVAKCEFHVHNEKFVLSQKAQLWSTDANEYVYIFKINNLNEELFLKCKDFAYEDGMKLINPKSGHMYSYITTIFICDTCDENCEKLMKKTKISKNAIVFAIAFFVIVFFILISPFIFSYPTLYPTFLNKVRI